MAINRITITQADKTKTFVYPYYTDRSEPLGSVLVLHGMAEHHERYTAFLEFLNQSGYDAFIYDHRGHGHDCKFEELGHFADHGGWRLVIDDALEVLKYVRSVNRGPKLILFGHSMGSLIGRCLIQEYDSIDGAVFCGTAHTPLLKSRAGIAIAALVKLFRGPRHRSPFLNSCTVGYSDFARISNRTSFDWLTRDNNIVGTYISDPYCGFLCTAAFYSDLIRLTCYADTPSRIAHTRRDLNILFVSGSNDPVGGYGHGVSSVFETFQSLGFTNTDCTIYDECRHELLNELNYDAIMTDIVNWIDRLGSAPEAPASEA